MWANHSAGSATAALSRDAVTVVATSMLFILLAQGGALDAGDAAILLFALMAYMIWTYWSERFNSALSATLHVAEAEELSVVPKTTFWITITLSAGLLLLVGGSKILLPGAVGIEEHFGVSQAVIGLTLIAVGTSLPELSMSVIAALREHADVAVGSILGSNILNFRGILGVSTLPQPLLVPVRIPEFEQWVMGGPSLL
jgi:cation:H+ antiporter